MTKDIPNMALAVEIYICILDSIKIASTFLNMIEYRIEQDRNYNIVCSWDNKLPLKITRKFKK